jgi:hypothetical protein
MTAPGMHRSLTSVDRIRIAKWAIVVLLAVWLLRLFVLWLGSVLV